MEPIVNIPPPVLARLLSLELIDGQGACELVPAGLRYDSGDPFAVALVFHDGSGPNIWTFARELLSEGLHAASGDGDVHVSPHRSDQGQAILLIQLATNDGAALLQANPAEIEAFLALSHDLVAPGDESTCLDIDALIGEILAAETTGRFDG